MTWKIIEHTDDHICIEFDDGRRLNYNISSLVEPPRQNAGDPAQPASGLHIGGTVYRFDAGGVLPTHTHDTPETLHTIECVEGRVLVRRAQSGDMILPAGETATVALGEQHSVEALEPSRTVHWRVT
jgi:quercetin dioxygenase-like cupin family protein